MEVRGVDAVNVGVAAHLQVVGRDPVLALMVPGELRSLPEVTESCHGVITGVYPLQFVPQLCPSGRVLSIGVDMDAIGWALVLPGAGVADR